MPLTEAQLQLRLQGITGCEIGMVAGLCPYAGDIEVYQVKKGIPVPKPPHHLERGMFCELMLLPWYIYRTGAELTYPGTIQSTEDPLIIATPDALAGERVVETKSPGPYTEHEWGTPGTDDIPEYYRAQVMWEMHVTGTKKADVVADIAGEMCIYPVEFSPAMFAVLQSLAHDFWEHHIVPGIPPRPDGSASYANFQQHTLAQTGSELEEDNSEITLHLIGQYVESEKHGDAKRKSVLRQLIVERIGGRAGIYGHYGKIHFKRCKDKRVVNWEALARMLLKRGDFAAREMIKDYTEVVPGKRLFKPYWSGEKTSL